MTECSGTTKGTRFSRLRTGYPRQRPKEGETTQQARARDTPQGAVPAMTGRAKSIPDISTAPSGKCQYDPNHDMRAKSDAYQGIIIRGIRKNANASELTIIL